MFDLPRRADLQILFEPVQVLPALRGVATGLLLPVQKLFPQFVPRSRTSRAPARNRAQYVLPRCHMPVGSFRGRAMGFTSGWLVLTHEPVCELCFYVLNGSGPGPFSPGGPAFFRFDAFLCSMIVCTAAWAGSFATEGPSLFLSRHFPKRLPQPIAATILSFVLSLRWPGSLLQWGTRLFCCL